MGRRAGLGIEIPAQVLVPVLTSWAWARGPVDHERGEETPQVSARRQLPAEGVVGGGQGKSQVSPTAQTFYPSVKIRGLEPGAQVHAPSLSHF